MIASVRGPVIHIGLDHVVVEAGGVGYLVNATPSTLSGLRRDAEATLLTTMIVREDAMTLYGFADAASRDFFHLLQTVTGVGPRLAMAILAVHDPQVLAVALASSDTAALQRVPGVGKRTAERLALELKDKVSALVPADVPASVPGVGSVTVGSGPARAQVVAALVGLGFGERQSETACAEVFDVDPGLDTAAGLRAALALLGGSR